MFNLQPGQGLGFGPQKLIAYGLGSIFYPFAYIPVEISASAIKETILTLSQLKETGITIGIKEAI